MIQDSPLIIITGPTASGKTGLSLAIAKKIHGSVLSADSRMVYQGLDIGTGKPTWEYRELGHSPWIHPYRLPNGRLSYSIDGVDHYLLDCVAPGVAWSLYDWLELAKDTIEFIRAQDRVPIIVGGTGLYIKSLIEGYRIPPTDPTLRAKLETYTERELCSALEKLDPVSAHREQKNRRRLVRALEVVTLTGKPIDDQPKDSPRPSLILAPFVARDELDRRITERLEQRIRLGLIDEVRSLLKAGINPDWLLGLGLEYRAVTEWLSSPDQSQRELMRTLATSIRHYARRQLTYVRHQLPVVWVRDLAQALNEIEIALSQHTTHEFVL